MLVEGFETASKGQIKRKTIAENSLITLWVRM
jgi:hypothetical protein